MHVYDKKTKGCLHPSNLGWFCGLGCLYVLCIMYYDKLCRVHISQETSKVRRDAVRGLIIWYHRSLGNVLNDFVGPRICFVLQRVPC
jgi:hypothetical protein